jgi:hypothetical protein
VGKNTQTGETSMTDEQRLKAAQMHEYAGESVHTITESREWYGRVLACDGFYLCVSAHGATWQTRSRAATSPQDIDTLIALLQRTKEILSGGAS